MHNCTCHNCGLFVVKLDVIMKESKPAGTWLCSGITGTCKCSAMDDAASPVSYEGYRQVTMTINGVTTSVLVPLPETVAEPGPPVTAESVKGNVIVVAPNSLPITTVADESWEPVTSRNSAASATVLRLAAAVSRERPPQPAKPPPVITIKPVVRFVQRPTFSREDRRLVMTVAPRRMPSAARAVTVEYPSGQRYVVPISQSSYTSFASTAGSWGSSGTSRLSPPGRPPCSLLQRPLELSHHHKYRPIILRKNLPSAAASSNTVVVRPCVHVSQQAASPAAVLGVVTSSPRTLSRREAIAAGWYSDDEKTAAADSAPDDDPAPVLRHIVPMDAVDRPSCDYADDPLPPEDRPKAGPSSSAAEPAGDEFVDRPLMGGDADDSLRRMKVIEIVPDDDAMMGDGVRGGDEAESRLDVKRPLPLLKDEFGGTAAAAAGDDDDEERASSRQCSSASTETAASEPELTSGVRAEDFVVLAEWSHDDPAEPDPRSSASRRPRKRRRRWRRCAGTGRKTSPAAAAAGSSSGVRCTARRSGGRPVSARERHGIVDCFVSLARLRLGGRARVDVRNAWRYRCCRADDALQRCRCRENGAPAGVPDSIVTAAAAAAGKQVPPDGTAVVEPSLVAARGSGTLPVELSGPTSADGVTPLVVRRPDGTEARVVARRTSPADHAGFDAARKKYLLVKARSGGAFLLPVNNPTPRPPAWGATAAADLPPTVKPPAAGATAAAGVALNSHRARIEQLKAQLRQQEQQLNSIRGHRHKLDPDDIR